MIENGRRFGGLLLLLGLLGACEDAVRPEEGDDPPPQATPARVHIGWISLSPRLAPPDSQGDPDAGWPEVGQTVTWSGHLWNSGEETADSVVYRWSVNDEEVLEGAVDMEAGETVVSLTESWPETRERITLVIEPPAGIRPDGDHSLTIRSDALSVGLWMDSTSAARMIKLGVLPFPVWAGREVRAWNRILERYSSEAGPTEVLDRIRLDRVEVVEDGSPWPRDITTDLAWYFLHEGFGIPEAMFNDMTMVFHEMGHQRGLTDLYAYRVYHDHPNGSEVLIREPDGSLAAGGERLPFLPRYPDYTGGEPVFLFESPYDDYLMGARYEHLVDISPHSAYGLNLLAGRRTPRWVDPWGNLMVGFASGSPHANPYLQRFPETLRLFVEIAGEPAPAGTRVEAFFDHAEHTYQNRHGPDPDLVAEVGDDGSTLLFPLDGLRAAEGRPADSDVIILRVTEGDRWGYAFLPEYELNLAYFRGRTDTAQWTIEVDVW